jgi:hypothetical protein
VLVTIASKEKVLEVLTNNVAVAEVPVEEELEPKFEAVSSVVEKDSNDVSSTTTEGMPDELDVVPETKEDVTEYAVWLAADFKENMVVVVSVLEGDTSDVTVVSEAVLTEQPLVAVLK